MPSDSTNGSISNRLPPPLPPRRSISSLVNVSTTLPSEDEPENPGFDDDKPMESAVKDSEQEPAEVLHNEQELRDLYENEEIERFLHLFSAYVTEVRLPGKPTVIRNSITSGEDGTTTLLDDEVHGEEWVSVSSAEKKASRYSSPSPAYSSISETIAIRYLVPILPPPHPKLPAFTLNRLRLTTQRLFLAIQPVYGPFIDRISRLATWDDYNRSLFYCVIFWTLWWYDKLLPALILRILYSLVRRKILPYPTLRELRQHREEVAYANEFGAQIATRLSATSTFGLKEIWKFVKSVNQAKKGKSKEHVKSKGKDPTENTAEPSVSWQEDVTEDMTAPEDDEESPEEKDIKRAVLLVLEDIADLHERIKNIFIWRRPGSSRIFSMVLFFLFLFTSFVPAQYLSKLTYFVGGFFFWHVTPIIAAMPPKERARIPPAFSDIPTDAEYAMELISQRVAAGLDITPSRNKNGKKQDHLGHDAQEYTNSFPESSQSSDKKVSSVDWRKWGERVAAGKSLANSGKQLISGEMNWPPVTSIANTGIPPVEAHTFPAQHVSALGLITLTADVVYFTPLLSQTAKISIDVFAIRAVKKAGMLKGLNLGWNETSSQGVVVEKEEKFIWVGGRDELFARLVGINGRRWMKV